MKGTRSTVELYEDEAGAEVSITNMDGKTIVSTVPSDDPNYNALLDMLEKFWLTGKETP